MWYRPDLARDQIEHFFDLWRPSDGQIAFTKRLNVLEDSANHKLNKISPFPKVRSGSFFC